MSIDWTMLSAVATAAAAVATAGAVVYNHLLWRQADRSRQTDLMLRLMDEYDRLHGDVVQLQLFFMECASASTGAVGYFADGVWMLDSISDQIRKVDNSRFALSRFFVRIRKLVRAGLLSEDVVLAALDRAAVEQVFLALVDPLDHAKAGTSYSAVDRQFYERLLPRYPPSKSNETT
jgi:hypothetical protein